MYTFSPKDGSMSIAMKTEPREDGNGVTVAPLPVTEVTISTPAEGESEPQVVPPAIPTQVAPIANLNDLVGLMASQLQGKNAGSPMSLPLNITGLTGASFFSTIEGLINLAPSIGTTDPPLPAAPTHLQTTLNAVNTISQGPMSPVGSIASVASPAPEPGGEIDDKSGVMDGQHAGGGKMKRNKSSARELAPGREEKLICGVCGDRALGCNFDAISCESCKAFFRRNALKDKKTKCLFDGSCKIDVNTRRFCPFCRLKKCFEIGMKKEFILGDEEKRKRLAKVMHNKDKKGVDGVDSVPASPHPIPAPATPGPSPTSSTVNATLPAQQTSPLANTAIPTVLPTTPIQLTSSQPAAQPQLVTIEIPPGSTEGVNLLSLSRFIKSNECFNVPMDSYLVRRLTVEESSMLQELMQLNFNVPMDSYLVRRLTGEESSMLQELMQVYDLSFTVDIEPLIHIQQVDPSLNQLVNQSSVTVLRIIKFAKRIEEFVRLPQECQIGILKGCWINILLLRSVSVYDSDRDTWLTARGEITTNILKNATGFVSLHDNHVNYCKSIKNIIKDDLTIVVLCIVIVLFAPEGPHVVTRELVSNIQDKYLVLLKHYLESKYMYARAAEMFPQLMSKMKELKELAEDHGKYLLDVNPSEIEPIMLEILDLK